MSWCWMGKSTNLSLFSFKIGSSSWLMSYAVISTRKIFRGYQRRPIPETFSINFLVLEEADGYRFPVSSVQMKQNRSKNQNAVFEPKITFVDNVWIECG